MSNTDALDTTVNSQITDYTVVNPQITDTFDAPVNSQITDSVTMQNTQAEKNVNVWASKYELQSLVSKLISSGYNNLLKLSKVTESELEKIGITQIGSRKKILSATNEIKKKN